MCSLICLSEYPTKAPCHKHRAMEELVYLPGATLGLSAVSIDPFRSMLPMISLSWYDERSSSQPGVGLHILGNCCKPQALIVRSHAVACGRCKTRRSFQWAQKERTGLLSLDTEHCKRKRTCLKGLFGRNGRANNNTWGKQVDRRHILAIPASPRQALLHYPREIYGHLSCSAQKHFDHEGQDGSSHSHLNPFSIILHYLAPTTSAVVDRALDWGRDKRQQIFHQGNPAQGQQSTFAWKALGGVAKLGSSQNHKALLSSIQPGSLSRDAKMFTCLNKSKPSMNS